MTGTSLSFFLLCSLHSLSAESRLSAFSFSSCFDKSLWYATCECGCNKIKVACMQTFCFLFGGQRRVCKATIRHRLTAESIRGFFFGLLLSLSLPVLTSLCGQLQFSMASCSITSSSRLSKSECGCNKT